ncbi:hypothetical protein DAKH74_027510 [Maudiozyma humilis]|uniref:GLEYA adhesin domain-containing protein n=1 Tax=Maudiozyma humilis TaxID=51915 RepID=A0AAV5RXJ1_MAUHU|nr:hypothetical protein DAKH74_027510 [Kazachstania humilis]
MININMQKMSSLLVYFILIKIAFGWIPIDSCHEPSNLRESSGWNLAFLDMPHSETNDLISMVNTVLSGSATGPDDGILNGAKTLAFNISATDPNLSQGLSVLGYKTTTTKLALLAMTGFAPKTSGNYTFTLENTSGTAIFQFQTDRSVACCENMFDPEIGLHIQEGQRQILHVASDPSHTEKSITVNLMAGFIYGVALAYVNTDGDATLKLSLTLPSGETITNLDNLVYVQPYVIDTVCENANATSWEFSTWSATYNSTYSTSVTTMDMGVMLITETIYYVLIPNETSSTISMSSVPPSSSLSSLSSSVSSASSSSSLASLSSLSSTSPLSTFASSSSVSFLSSSSSSSTTFSPSPLSPSSPSPSSSSTPHPTLSHSFSSVLPLSVTSSTSVTEPPLSQITSVSIPSSLSVKNSDATLATLVSSSNISSPTMFASTIHNVSSTLRSSVSFSSHLTSSSSFTLSSDIHSNSLRSSKSSFTDTLYPTSVYSSSTLHLTFSTSDVSTLTITSTTSHSPQTTPSPSSIISSITYSTVKPSVTSINQSSSTTSTILVSTEVQESSLTKNSAFSLQSSIHIFTSFVTSSLTDLTSSSIDRSLSSSSINSKFPLPTNIGDGSAHSSEDYSSYITPSPLTEPSTSLLLSLSTKSRTDTTVINSIFQSSLTMSSQNRTTKIIEPATSFSSFATQGRSSSRWQSSITYSTELSKSIAASSRLISSSITLYIPPSRPVSHVIPTKVISSLSSRKSSISGSRSITPISVESSSQIISSSVESQVSSSWRISASSSFIFESSTLEPSDSRESMMSSTFNINLPLSSLNYIRTVTSSSPTALSSSSSTTPSSTRSPTSSTRSPTSSHHSTSKYTQESLMTTVYPHVSSTDSNYHSVDALTRNRQSNSSSFLQSTSSFSLEVSSERSIETSLFISSSSQMKTSSTSLINSALPPTPLSTVLSRTTLTIEPQTTSCYSCFTQDPSSKSSSLFIRNSEITTESSGLLSSETKSKIYSFSLLKSSTTSLLPVSTPSYPVTTNFQSKATVSTSDQSPLSPNLTATEAPISRFPLVSASSSSSSLRLSSLSSTSHSVLTTPSFSDRNISSGQSKSTTITCTTEDDTASGMKSEMSSISTSISSLSTYSSLFMSHLPSSSLLRSSTLLPDMSTSVTLQSSKADEFSSSASIKASAIYSSESINRSSTRQSSSTEVSHRSLDDETANSTHRTNGSSIIAIPSSQAVTSLPELLSKTHTTFLSVYHPTSQTANDSDTLAPQGKTRYSHKPSANSNPSIITCATGNTLSFVTISTDSPPNTISKISSSPAVVNQHKPSEPSVHHSARALSPNNNIEHGDQSKGIFSIPREYSGMMEGYGTIESLFNSHRSTNASFAASLADDYNKSPTTVMSETNTRSFSSAGKLNGPEMVTIVSKSKFEMANPNISEEESTVQRKTNTKTMSSPKVANMAASTNNIIIFNIISTFFLLRI